MANIKIVASDQHVQIERVTSYNHCVNEQVEWVVRSVVSGLIVATYKLKKEAMYWLKDLTV